MTNGETERGDAEELPSAIRSAKRVVQSGKGLRLGCILVP